MHKINTTFFEFICGLALCTIIGKNNTRKEIQLRDAIALVSLKKTSKRKIIKCFGNIQFCNYKNLMLVVIIFYNIKTIIVKLTEVQNVQFYTTSTLTMS